MRVFVALLIVGLSLLLATWLKQRSASPIPEKARPSAFDATPAVRQVNVQDAGDASRETETLPAPHPLSETLCPVGMVWVQGQYCALPAKEGAGCAVSTQAIGVCMDEFEYPNQVGVYPAVMLDARAARRICAAENKRLCRDAEWTFACQTTVEQRACNTGRAEKLVRVQRLQQAEHISEELAAHDARRTSEPNACVNHSRAFDLLGNVQEWVQSEHRLAFEGALKGGRYNQGLIGCERSIQVKDPWARYPHTGLRCCRDPLVELPGFE